MTSVTTAFIPSGCTPILQPFDVSTETNNTRYPCRILLHYKRLPVPTIVTQLTYIEALIISIYIHNSIDFRNFDFCSHDIVLPNFYIPGLGILPSKVIDNCIT